MRRVEAQYNILFTINSLNATLTVLAARKGVKTQIHDTGNTPTTQGATVAYERMFDVKCSAVICC